jgi:GAF domain-containing protein
VPIVWEEHIIRIINVYDKLPRSAIEMNAFSDDDRTLLETFAMAVAHLLARADGLDR